MNRTLWVLQVAVMVAGCKGEATTKARPAAASSAGPVASPADSVASHAQPAAFGACKGTELAVPDPEGLAFLDSLGGRLDVELTEAPVKISPNLENEKAPPSATIKSVKLDAYKFEKDDLRPLSTAELDRVVFRGAVLQLRGLGKVVKHTAADCQFTVLDVLDAVEETERQTRGDSEWFEGVDVHHKFFEGLNGGEDGGVWDIGWGS
jgi:hypothetical protein